MTMTPIEKELQRLAELEAKARVKCPAFGGPCICDEVSAAKNEWDAEIRNAAPGLIEGLTVACSKKLAEEYIQLGEWSEDATDHEKLLVAGNVRGFSAYIESQISKALKGGE